MVRRIKSNKKTKFFSALTFQAVFFLFLYLPFQASAEDFPQAEVPLKPSSYKEVDDVIGDASSEERLAQRRKILEQQVSYYVLNQDVKSVFADFSKIIKAPLVVSPSAKGKATSGKYQGTTTEIMDMICKDLNLHWYFDGNSFYVTHASEAVTRVVSLTAFSYGDLKSSLDAVGIDYSRYPLKFDGNNNILVLYGPPRFIAGVEAIADSIASYRSNSRPNVIRR